MITRLVALILVVTLSACGEQQASATADAAAADIRIEAIRAHIEFLADDLLGGRETGSSGYDTAAAYVASEFAQIGLQPAGTDGSWYQSFDAVQEQLVTGSAEVILHQTDGDVRLVKSEEFLVGGSYVDTRNDVTAPVTFVGFGVTAPELDYDDYAGVDVSGRVVAMFAGAPATFPHDQRAYYSSGLAKYGNAASRGAVATIVFYTDERLQRYSWEERVKSWDFPGMRWMSSDGSVQGVYPPIEMGIVLGPQGLERLLESSGLSSAELQAQAAESRPGAVELPVSITLRRQSTQTIKRTANVAAMLPGSDPDLADEYVVLTAHLDHIGVGPEVDGDTIYNGAYDNATGIAIMLEVARAMAESEHRPARSILFLAVGGEEQGMMGSEYFAENPTVSAENMIANVNLDMPLFIYPPADVVAFGAEHSDLEGVVERAAERTGFVLSPDPMPEEVIFVRSDQYPFVRKGVPAVYLIPGFTSADPEIDGNKRYIEFLRSTYHKPSDEVGLPFDDESVVRFTLLNYLVASEIANAPDRPRWQPGDFFGDKFGAARGSASP